MSVAIEGRSARMLHRARGADQMGRRASRRLRNRWLTLFIVTRAAAIAVALVLLAAHRITAHDAALAAAVLGYGAASIVAAVRVPSLQRSAAAWAVDCGAALGFVFASGDWRSAFYVLALSALVLPATTLSFRAALAFAAVFDLAFLVVAVRLGVDWSTVDSTARLETFATHLMVPLLVVLSLAYAADLLRSLRAERRRAERLLLETERRRMAWELHDSVKQRLHAAHLLLTALGDNGPTVRQARGEVEAAVVDMDRSVRELRDPLPDDGGILGALRGRADALANAGSATIHVDGDEPFLPAIVAEQAYRIVAEAMTNAVRHAAASRITVELQVEDGDVVVRVRDDGRGFDSSAGDGVGLSSMRARAADIGAALKIAGADGGGTEVRLAIPLADPNAEELR
jgi:signal transduction histidine kinase